MDPLSQLRFSVTNKKNLRQVVNFWHDMIVARKENINNTLSLNKEVFFYFT
jgi:hypothetical protein